MGLWMRDLLVSAAASVLIITFLYQPVRVEGTSMLPRLEDSDRLFINKFVYHFTAIERATWSSSTIPATRRRVISSA